MATPRKRKRLLDAYRFPGFRPLDELHGIFGDPRARVIPLVRRSKKPSAGIAVERMQVGTTGARGERETCPAATRGSTWSSKCVGCAVAATAK
jgi:hypothetical protein